MSTDLVSSITQVLSSSLVARIASSLGLDKTVAEKALQAGVPGLLAALTSIVSKPAGAAALNGAIAQQQPGVLSSLASVIGGSAQKSLIDTGTSTLTSLLGGTTTSALTDAIGRYAGIGDAGSKSLMGLLGPVVMGVLGQQQRASGLDATGLANLLASQKDNIARSLPAGFSKYLGGTDILDSLVDWSTSVAHRRQLPLPDPQGPVTRHPRRRGLRQGRKPLFAMGLAHSGAGGRGNRRSRLALAFAPEPDGNGCHASTGED